MRQTAAEGGRLRTLVFLPGFTGSAESYRALLAPGHGEPAEVARQFLADHGLI